MEKRYFPSIGDKISLLGFGTMRFPLKSEKYEDIDLEKTQEMIDFAMAQGINYYDTAYMYHDGKSELAVRETLVKKYPRETYFLTDKLPVWLCETYEDYERIFEEQLEKCGVTYFDYYLVHSLNAVSYEKHKKLGAFRFVEEKKKEGKIRHTGFSFHDGIDALKPMIDEQSDIDFVQLQINYLDWDGMDIKKGYQWVEEAGKKVIVMEPVRGGTLANLTPSIEEIFKKANPEASSASWALRFAASLPNTMVVLSGMSTLDQVKDNCKTFSPFEFLSNDERGVIHEVLEELKKIPNIACTACRYCQGCPVNIDIPNIFDLYNTAMRTNQIEAGKKKYQDLKEGSRASNCISCGQCVEHCPQHLPIPDDMKKVAVIFE